MKKALSVVVLLIVIAPAFAADVVWETSQEPPFGILQKDVPRAELAKPQPVPQKEQKRPDNVPPLVDTQKSAAGAQAGSNQAHKGTELRKELSDSDKIQQRLADLTEQLVYVGWGQLVIIFLQVVYGVRAANAAAKSADVAERSLKTVERARLFVSQWKIEPSEIEGWSAVTFMVGNAGRTPAHLKTKRVGAVIMDKLPEQPNYGAFPEQALNFTMQAGGIMKDILLVFHPDAFGPVRVEDHEGVNSGRLVLYCCGAIPYTDDFGDAHEVGFLAKYNPIKKEFSVVTTHPDYNYST